MKWTLGSAWSWVTCWALAKRKVWMSRPCRSDSSALLDVTDWPSGWYVWTRWTHRNTTCTWKFGKRQARHIVCPRWTSTISPVLLASCQRKSFCFFSVAFSAQTEVVSWFRGSVARALFFANELYRVINVPSKCTMRHKWDTHNLLWTGSSATPSWEWFTKSGKRSKSCLDCLPSPTSGVPHAAKIALKKCMKVSVCGSSTFKNKLFGNFWQAWKLIRIGATLQSFQTVMLSKARDRENKENWSLCILRQ